MQISSKSILQGAGLGLVGLLTLVGCAPAAVESEEAASVVVAETPEFDWRSQEGESIRFVAGLQPWQEAVVPLIADFEALTGITVEVEALPEDQFRQRLQVELTAGSGDIDVFMTSVLQDGPRFSESGWYADLEPLVSDPLLTSPDYDFSDISSAVLEGHTFNGVLSALPIQLEVQMLYYRKDLLKAAGFDGPPTTYEELEEMAAALYDPTNNLYGFASRGKGAATVTQITTFLRSHGADYLDANGKAGFASEQGIKAIDEYGRLIRTYGPSGSVNNSWEELLALFQSGSIALWSDNSGQAKALRDPSASSVADVVGYAVMPAGPVTASQSYFGWASAIAESSKKKEAAWLFLQWLTGPDVVSQLQESGIPGGRVSIGFGSDVPEEFVTTFQTALASATAQLPAVKPVPEVRDAIGAAVVASILGENVTEAVRKAAKEFDRIVESAD
jgi:multiple sugar transport system substrate-binding protein